MRVEYHGKEVENGEFRLLLRTKSPTHNEAAIWLSALS